MKYVDVPTAKKDNKVSSSTTRTSRKANTITRLPTCTWNTEQQCRAERRKNKKRGRASDPDNKIWNSRNWNNLGIYNRRRKKGNAGASNLLSTPFPARARTTLAIEVSFPFSDRLIFYRFPGAYPIASLFVCLFVQLSRRSPEP